ncbi:MAG: hypothetical protein SGPRY_011727, partial [Prymnesium sp.]
MGKRSLLAALLVPLATALAPRRVLITGANKGIGRQLARRIVQDYPDVHVLLGARSTALGEKAVQEILAEVPDAKIETLQIDVSSEESVNTLDVNTYGPKRVCDAFIPLLDPEVGRVCNIASASGPNFVRGLSPEQQNFFTSPETTWEELDAVLKQYAAAPDYEGVAYGLSKASLNLLTMIQAAAHPNLQINSCSPGYILTDITRGMGASSAPEDS